MNRDTPTAVSTPRKRPERYPFCVLIVDDEVPTARDIVVQLRALGHEAHSASDHREGLQLAAKLLPHVILVTLRPPLTAHRDLVRELRAAMEPEETYVVAVTSYDPDTNRPGSVAAGFDEHLWRPIGPRLLEALMAYLSLKLRSVESVRPEGGCAKGASSNAAAVSR